MRRGDLRSSDAALLKEHDNMEQLRGFGSYFQKSADSMSGLIFPSCLQVSPSFLIVHQGPVRHVETGSAP